MNIYDQIIEELKRYSIIYAEKVKNEEISIAESFKLLHNKHEEIIYKYQNEPMKD